MTGKQQQAVNAAERMESATTAVDRFAAEQEYATATADYLRSRIVAVGISRDGEPFEVRAQLEKAGSLQ